MSVVRDKENLVVGKWKNIGFRLQLCAVAMVLMFASQSSRDAPRDRQSAAIIAGLDTAHLTRAHLNAREPVKDCGPERGLAIGATLQCHKSLNSPQYSAHQVAALAALSGLLVGVLALTLRVLENRSHRNRLDHAVHELEGARKSERKQIARELHDGVCQLLAATRHSLEAAYERALIGDGSHLEKLTKGIRQLDETIQEVRRVSQGLKPALPSNLTLTEALRILSFDFFESTQIQTRLVGIDAGRTKGLSHYRAVALYRIAQEALMNIEKHSSASQIELRLEQLEGWLTLAISDNGLGFERDLSLHSRRCGIGLSNMRERLREVGGRFSLSSTKRGTRIVASVPLTEAVRTDCAA